MFVLLMATAEEVAEMYKDRIRGKVFVITGCNHGIGKETALQLARHGGIGT